MGVSIFLAKYFGIYLFLVSTTVLFEPLQYKSMVKNFKENDGLVALGAILSLMLGLFLVLIHSIFVYDWRIIITILCWLIFIKGWLLFAFPKKMMQWGSKTVKKKSTYNIILLGYIIISLYLIYHGFFMNR